MPCTSCDPARELRLANAHLLLKYGALYPTGINSWLGSNPRPGHISHKSAVDSSPKPKKDMDDQMTKKGKGASAPEAQIFANCLAPNGEHGVTLKA